MCFYAEIHHLNLKHIAFMKLSELVKVTFGILLLIGVFSCSDETSDSINRLKQAQEILDTNPNQAFTSLESISDPEAMGKEYYMQYILALTKAKKDLGENISSDTLIYQVEQYYEVRDELANSALAHYLAGWIHNLNKESDLSINSYMKAEPEARKAGLYPLAGNITNNIGHLYYEDVILDSALVYFERALRYYDYDKSKVPDLSLIRTYTNIGVTLQELGDFDLAIDYYFKGLPLADRTNNRTFQSILNNNIGSALRHKKDNQNAKKYLFKALELKECEENVFRPYLNLAQLYNTTNQPDSVQYYIELIKSKIYLSSDRHTSRLAYHLLFLFYKGIGDIQESSRYFDLMQQTEKRIERENQALKLYEGSMQMHLDQKEKELQKANSKNRLMLFMTFFVVVCFFYVGYVIVSSVRDTYRNYMNNADGEKNKYTRKTNNIILLQNAYSNSIDNLIYLDKKAKRLENKKKEKPEVYSRTKQMVLEMKRQTQSQLIGWAKDCLENNSPTSKIMNQLDDEDVLLLALLACKYTENEIELILDFKENAMLLKKLELRNLLEVSGYSDTEIDTILFVENKRILSHD